MVRNGNKGKRGNVKRGLNLQAEGIYISNPEKMPIFLFNFFFHLYRVLDN